MYYVPWSRAVCKRCHDEMRPSHLVVTSLTHGSWSGNIVDRKPPRGGGFLSINPHVLTCQKMLTQGTHNMSCWHTCWHTDMTCWHKAHTICPDMLTHGHALRCWHKAHTRHTTHKTHDTHDTQDTTYKTHKDTRHTRHMTHTTHKTRHTRQTRRRGGCGYLPQLFTPEGDVGGWGKYPHWGKYPEECKGWGKYPHSRYPSFPFSVSNPFFGSICTK